MLHMSMVQSTTFVIFRRIPVSTSSKVENITPGLKSCTRNFRPISPLSSPGKIYWARCIWEGIWFSPRFYLPKSTRLSTWQINGDLYLLWCTWGAEWWQRSPVLFMKYPKRLTRCGAQDVRFGVSGCLLHWLSKYLLRPYLKKHQPAEIVNGLL